LKNYKKITNATELSASCENTDSASTDEEIALQNSKLTCPVR